MLFFLDCVCVRVKIIIKKVSNYSSLSSNKKKSSKMGADFLVVVVVVSSMRAQSTSNIVKWSTIELRSHALFK